MQYHHVDYKKLEKYVRAADSGDNATGNFVNYGVRKKTDGPLFVRKLLLILGYVLFVGIFAAFCFGLILPVKIPPLFALVDREAVENLFRSEPVWPWYGQLMQLPQTMAYMLQLNFWLKQYSVRIL